MKMLDILQALCEQGVSNNALNYNVLISPDDFFLIISYLNSCFLHILMRKFTISYR